MAACQSDTYHIKGEARELADGTVLYLTEGIGSQRVVDSVVVGNGRFSYEGTTAGEPPLRALRPAGQQQESLYFFAEPGNIYVELSPHEGCSRVSGTKVNNEWQALCDTVAKYDREIRHLFDTDSLQPRNTYAVTERLYTTLSRRISDLYIV